MVEIGVPKTSLLMALIDRLFSLSKIAGAATGGGKEEEECEQAEVIALFNKPCPIEVRQSIYFESRFQTVMPSLMVRLITRNCHLFAFVTGGCYCSNRFVKCEYPTHYFCKAIAIRLYVRSESMNRADDLSSRGLTL